jgi:succinoglycan biosynthesis transport protein ExoP
MATEYELTLTDYLSIMRRRASYLAGTFVVVLLVSIIVAFAIPPTYRATGTIMVESQQVPENIVATEGKNQLDERIEMIKRRVLTRDSLLRIANKYNLFKERALFLTSSELIERMRDRVGVELINSNDVQGNRQAKSTIAFNLSFEDKRPEIAHQVASDLVTLFLDWNIKLRTEGATETTLFLTQELDKLKLEVERLESLISAYKQKNSNALPEQLTLRMTMMSRAENDLREIERDYRSTKEELRSLQVELSAAKYGMGNDPSQALPELKAELTKLSATYNESHPDIRALKRKIEAMEKVADTPESASAVDKAPTLAVYKIQSKIDSANARLESLGQQQKMLQDKIAQNERAMILTPKVEQGLDILIRDRDNAQKKYEEILSKKMSAKIAESLESESKSERFTLLEPPILPEKPFKPDRVKIIALGFFLAIASAGGMLMTMVTFNRQVRGADALAHVLGYRPLAIIPYLVIKEEEVLRKRMLKRAIIASVLAVIIIAVAIHFLYMPLGDLFTKILSRLV